MTDTEKIADVVVAAVRAATAPLLERIAVLEARAPVPGPAGKDAPVIDLDVLAVRAAALVPTPKDGRDGIDGKDGPIGAPGDKGLDGKDGPAGKDAPAVDLDAVAVHAAALIPAPKDGRNGLDGKDAPPIDVDDVARRAATLIPAPKDGTSIASALIDASGRLILTFTDGLTKDVGEVVGKPGRDGLAGQPGRSGEKGADGKDGLDGLGFDDIRCEYDGERAFGLKFQRGDRVKEIGGFVLPLVIYRGVFTQGKSYDKGDAVTQGGSYWIAREATMSKPGDGATAWQLAVKAGRDGREGKQGSQGLNGVKGEKGDAGRNFS